MMRWFIGRDSRSSFEIVLPLVHGGTYNFYINWGDGSPVQHITKFREVSHQYARAGMFTTNIIGTFIGFKFACLGVRLGDSNPRECRLASPGLFCVRPFQRMHQTTVS